MQVALAEIDLLDDHRLIDVVRPRRAQGLQVTNQGSDVTGIVLNEPVDGDAIGDWVEGPLNDIINDWIDNDADGAVDCNDMDCNGTQVCRGSWRDPNESGGGQNSGSSDIPELPAGSTVADLIGTGGDLDGERNDMLCSDGIDNDGDGQI
ncbi:MAG TPA: hypothetical protein EYQ80_00800, partial [Candidatus Poseidoniales archaeon]|nr:hypothetical protein [Candidatus Poseidoniales archaeon]